MSGDPGGREAYLNAAALLRAHYNQDTAAEQAVVDQLDAGERTDVIWTLTSVASWLLSAYCRTSGITAEAALDLLLGTIQEEE